MTFSCLFLVAAYTTDNYLIITEFYMGAKIQQKFVNGPLIHGKNEKINAMGKKDLICTFSALPWPRFS